MDSAAENGHLEVVQWMHWNRSEGCTTSAMNGAASKRFGHPAGDELGIVCPDAASLFYENQLEVVRWLRSNRSEGCTTNAMDGAAANGNLQMMQWLHENSVVGCSSAAMDSAADLGRLDILEWLHVKQLAECTTLAMDSAAANGHLQVLKWLHANQSDGHTTKAIKDAAAGGHLRVVKWLLSSSRCPSQLALTKSLGNAISSEKFEVALYIQAHQKAPEAPIPSLTRRRQHWDPDPPRNSTLA